MGESDGVVLVASRALAQRLFLPSDFYTTFFGIPYIYAHAQYFEWGARICTTGSVYKL